MEIIMVAFTIIACIALVKVSAVAGRPVTMNCGHTAPCSRAAYEHTCERHHR